jgi:DNA-binding response OmpR family regulator
MAKILVIDNDTNAVSQLREFLTYDHNQVDVAADGLIAQGMISRRGYDVLVLDWCLARHSAAQICRAYRENGGTGWILVVSERGDVEELEAAFEAGADDFLARPYQIRELAARIRAMMRRQKPVPAPLAMAYPSPVVSF